LIDKAAGMDLVREHAVRAALFGELDRRVMASQSGALRYQDTASFDFNDERITVRQIQGRGINKPRQLDAAISITTTYTPQNSQPPYEDLEGEDGHLRYAYEGTDPDLFTNRALRTCMKYQLPLVYFFGLPNAQYKPVYPAYIIGEEQQLHRFIVGFEVPRQEIDPIAQIEIERSYAKREVEVRIHQPVFRQLVLSAYEMSCGICSLKHPELLDAAHVLPDKHPLGKAIVSNGIALCKIHHTAYDRNFIGITPDYKVKVRKDLMLEQDGPMLKHGIQEMNESQLFVPRSKHERPLRENLEIRFAEFLSSATN
jgi:putative restriction endonuclease